MKIFRYILLLFVSIFVLHSCSDDEKGLGNPTIDSKTEFTSAMFGDSLKFSIDVTDADIALSTLKVRLYYTDDLVSETVIRTKTNGNYEGKIFVPYYANVPNNTATLTLVLQNTSLTITEKSYDLALTRPDFPYLTLVTSKEEYRMERTALYSYEAKREFPMKIKGYIKAPAVGADGNEITFGWENNQAVENSTTDFPFSNSIAGEYAITFNTFNYEVSPFIVGYSINGMGMARVDDDNYKVDRDFTQGEEVVVGGIENIGDWWIDPDFMTKDVSGKITFAPLDGKYRVIANFVHQYLRFEALDASGNLATLQDNGSGSLWVLGNNIGKPSVKANQTGWTESKGLCFVYLGNKKHQISFVAGETISADKIDFKLFHQRGWGGEFKTETLTTDSDLIGVGTGEEGKAGNGNLFLKEGKTLTEGKTYIFTVDLSKGNDKAVLTIEEK